MSLFRRSRIRRTRRGAYRVELPEEERDLLRRLLPQLRSSSPTTIPTTGAPAACTRRPTPTTTRPTPSTSGSCARTWWPPGWPPLDAVEASVDATELDEQQLMAWLGAVNNLRLVLGTMLDVSEELEIGELPDGTPDVEAYALYAYLSSLLGEIVDALDPADGSEPPGPSARRTGRACC